MREFKISFEANKNSIPVRATQSSAGIDIRLDNISDIYRFGIYKLSDKKVSKINSRLSKGKSFTLWPFDRVVCGNGFTIDMHKDCYAEVCSRSGLSAKQGIVVTNSPGIIDSDYKKEVKTILSNTTIGFKKLSYSERIAQLIIRHKTSCSIEGIETLSAVRDNGFGSSGKK